ncbi:tandem-95 repeat protein, partial [bacterium]|nr:tandem-95 repeat protein [bacterium]
TLTVSDGSLSDSEAVTITVNNVNRAPVLAAIGNKSVNTGSSLTFTIAATDPDGNSLGYSATGLPSGASFNGGTRTFSWTPTSAQAGSYQVTFSVSDGSLSDSETVTISVGAVNQPPVLAAIGPQGGQEGQALAFTVSATDPDGDSLSYSASGLPSGASFNVNTRVFYWEPDYDQAGTRTVTFAVSDGSLSDSEAVVITIASANRAPVLAAIGNKSISEGAALSFTVTATDADGDSLSYSASGLPSGASFIASTRTFSWTPGYDQAGNYQVALSVSDGSLSDSETITISVGPVNQPPVLAAIGNRSVDESQALNFTVSASDPDGDNLSYSASALPSGASFNANTRTFNWTPTSAQAGNYQVTFSVSDGSLSDSETIAISVGAVNQPPVLAAIGTQAVQEGQTLAFTLSATDPDGDSLSYSASGLPNGASFNTASRVFYWEPGYAQAGTYTVTFAVSDGSLIDSEAALITIANFNRAPVLTVPGDQAVEPGQLVTFSVSATDPDGDGLNYSASTVPAGASFNAATRTFGWTPTTEQTGDHAVVFTATDGSLSDSRSVAVHVSTVAADNSPPEIEDPGLNATAANTPLTVQATVSDRDNDPITYSATSLPAGATIDPDSGLHTWVPTLSQVGGHTSLVLASDGEQTTSVLAPLLVVHPDYDWVAGAKLFAYRIVQDKVIVGAWRRPDRTALVIAWCRPGETVTLQATPKMDRTDLYNQPVNPSVLGATPVLFHSNKRVSPNKALGDVVDAFRF